MAFSITVWHYLSAILACLSFSSSIAILYTKSKSGRNIETISASETLQEHALPAWSGISAWVAFIAGFISQGGSLVVALVFVGTAIFGMALFPLGCVLVAKQVLYRFHEGNNG